jgi:hypothetical protein
VKNGTLILVAALALVAAAPPPPPTLPASSPSPAISAAPSTPAAVASASPAPLASPTSDPYSIFGKPPGGASPTPKDKRPTPPPDDRKGLDGVWEIAIQPVGSDTLYEHFNLKQTGLALAGTYLNHDNKKSPLSGAIDGTTVRLVVTLPDGTTLILEGRLDGTTDMVGILTDAKGRTPFTAAYRPKERWIDNINATPGGLGGGGIPPR